MIKLLAVGFLKLETEKEQYLKISYGSREHTQKNLHFEEGTNTNLKPICTVLAFIGLVLLYCALALVYTFFCSKDSTWNPYEQAKKVLQTFRFRVQFQNSHVPIVNDYADTEF